MNITRYADPIAEICATYGVQRLALFGSALRDDFDPQRSDLDFVVEFAPPHLPGAFDRYFGLKEALERLFQRPVDLVEHNAIKNPYFLEVVNRDKSPIYEIGAAEVGA